MDKDAAPLSGGAGSRVEDGRAVGLELSECFVNIGDLEAEVMQPLTASFQETRDAGRGIGWLQQFDLAAARSTQRQEGDLDALTGKIEHTRGGNAKRVAVE